MKKTMITIFSSIIISLTASIVYAHCQVPCGIYEDSLVFKQMLLDATTIKKSIMEIKRLSKAKPVNYNQLVRWTEEKSRSADNIMNNVSNYFLAQRIKTTDRDYIGELKLLHSIIVDAMKTKQSLNKANVDLLSKNINSFELQYNSK
ncbi:MAG: superoxide dismutase [bacterium]|nr:superoxide dismutase [bacterium]